MMRTHRIAVAVAAAAVLAACSNGGVELPATHSAGRAPAGTAHNDGRSWIDPASSSGTLVYISDQYLKKVFIYSYPALQLVGTLTGFAQPDGECVDAAGDVWITDLMKSQLVEYAHGSTQVKATLSDTGYLPYSCAVDPTNGDIAAVNFEANPTPGSISIFKKARGTPHVHTFVRLSVPFFAAYDARGRLFVDGYSGFYSPVFVLARIRNTNLTEIALNQQIDSPGDVVIVGSRVNIGDGFRDTRAVYGFKVSGRAGTLIGTTRLRRTDVIEEFAVVGRSLITTNVNQLVGSAMVFGYPKGGSPKDVFGKGTLEGPVGLVISK